MGMSVVDGMFVLKVHVRAEINDDRLVYQLLVLRSGVYDIKVEEQFAIRLGDTLVITRTFPEIILKIFRPKETRRSRTVGGTGRNAEPRATSDRRRAA
ncbi:hypothetical protein [Aureimonas leprariae]|uniref:Uncharacterized protein n=1 Tax=Plantimonas leprariae TaxID=2615207 RepID=A0A7V7PNT4_9HYPH|nr:hypothetical protein [Aureimonas leprariae]KAB0679546.1 hypothetical protein F6X38_12030 [Aureimonas leprariae]